MYAKLKKPGSSFFEVKKVHTMNEDEIVFSNGKRLALPTDDWEVEFAEEVVVRGCDRNGVPTEISFMGPVAVYREEDGYMAEMTDEDDVSDVGSENGDLVLSSPRQVLFVRMGN